MMFAEVPTMEIGVLEDQIEALKAELKIRKKIVNELKMAKAAWQPFAEKWNILYEESPSLKNHGYFEAFRRSQAAIETEISEANKTIHVLEESLSLLEKTKEAILNAVKQTQNSPGLLGFGADPFNNGDN